MMRLLVACGVSIGIMMTACVSGGGKEGQATRVVETSTEDGKRPSWTYEPVDIQKLRSEMKDSTDNPKNAYFVATSTVARSDLAPNCYQMARTRASGEFAAGISQKIQDANALAEDQGATEFQRQLEAQTKTFLVGAHVTGQTWAKIEEDGDTKVRCWVVLAVPVKNLENLRKQVLKMLEDGAQGDNQLKERANSAVARMASEH